MAERELNMEKICVAVRLRPSASLDSLCGSYWKVDDNRISLHRAHGTPISSNSYAFGTFTIHFSLPFLTYIAHVFIKLHKFPVVCSSYLFIVDLYLKVWSFLLWTLDHVLDESCTNGSVYELVVRDIIHAAVEGFNGMLLSLFFISSLFLCYNVIEDSLVRKKVDLSNH